jgi:hypothetical protein
LRELQGRAQAATQEPADTEGGLNVYNGHLEDARRDQKSPRTAADSLGTPYVLRLDGVPSTPASLIRIRERVDEINRQFRQARVPFQLRVI